MTKQKSANMRTKQWCIKASCFVGILAGTTKLIEAIDHLFKTIQG